jgi:uncharacterized protein (TIGR04255 family)
VTRRIYPNPPIVEAVIEFRVGSQMTGAELARSLRDKLAHTYDAAEMRAQDLVQAHVSVEGGGVAAASKRQPHFTFLQSASGHRLLGCGPGVLSVHTLAPYPGWESFLAQATEAVTALPGPLAETPVRTVGVRYIDRITLPDDEDVPLGEYITVLPPRPIHMPDALVGCHYVTQSSDPSDGTFAQLTVSSPPMTPDGKAYLLYDLLLNRTGETLCTFEVDSWVPIVEGLHARLREIFEESITDRTRELFQ